MKHLRVAVLACFVLAGMLIPGLSFGAEKSTMEFCSNFNDSWKAEGASTTFNTNIISWLAAASEAFGAQQVTLSIYKRQGSEEKLVERKSIDVRPTWNTVGMRNMKLPSEGEYSLSLEKADGKVLSEGKVKITKMQDPSAKAAPKTETLGATLSDLFNKYKPKK